MISIGLQQLAFMLGLYLVCEIGLWTCFTFWICDQEYRYSTEPIILVIIASNAIRFAVVLLVVVMMTGETNDFTRRDWFTSSQFFVAWAFVLITAEFLIYQGIRYGLPSRRIPAPALVAAAYTGEEHDDDPR